MKNLLMVLSITLLLCNCGGGGKTTTTTTTTTPAVTIVMGTAPSSLAVGQTYQFSATVSNTSNTAVTWTAGGVTGGNSTVGTISSSGLYTAPALVPSPQTVTIMATSQADTTKSASATTTINISFSLNMNSTSLPVTGTQQFTATITGTTNTTVTWAVNGVAGGNSTVGTISAARPLHGPPGSSHSQHGDRNSYQCGLHYHLGFDCRNRTASADHRGGEPHCPGPAGRSNGAVY